MYTGLHNHTAIGSNIRGFLDSINRVEDLIQYAKDLGHGGIAITDHDCISAHMDAQNYYKKLQKDNPNLWEEFKLILGNEIYLCSKKDIIEDKKYKFYHFILLAKDEVGHHQLRELSTRAWCENSFFWVNIRTPTYFDDLFEIIEQDRGHIIASSACLGGQIPQLILEAYYKDNNNPDYTLVEKFIKRMVKCFGEGNFYLEMQPSLQEEQMIVNKAIIKLSKKLNVPYIITTDAHYLKKEDKPIHEAFLKSNESSEREVGDFYNTTYVMSEQELHEYLDKSIGANVVQQAFDNSQNIINQCCFYDLSKPLDIPYVAFDKTEPDKALYQKYKEKMPLLEYFYNSDIDCNRHLCRDIINKIESKPEEFANQETYNAIQDCLDTLIATSKAQNTAWSGYLLVCKDLVKTIWESNSLCGPARGSGTGFILLYLLDITQVNPLREDTKTYHWRFLNPKRLSEPDIDLDSEGSKKEIIIENLRKKYGGYRYVTKVQTILTAKSRNALQIACRGLGYTVEEGTYLASFIKAERGIQFNLHQTFYGDENRGLAPDKEFAKLMTDKYPDVWEIAQKIEGLCVGVGSHAGGVIVSNKDLVENVSLMKTGSGDIITAFDLHKAEQAGLIKFDLLNIDALEKIHIALDLLMKDGIIEWQGDLKSTYDKYVGVYNIERANSVIWEMIQKHQILSLFQFEKQSGWQAIELGKPDNLMELTALNSVMRLMAQPGQLESPLQIYNKHKIDINTWYQEMDEYGLTKDEQEIVKKYALQTYGLLPNQENFMLAVQDEAMGGWDLGFADRIRKAVGKKIIKDFAGIEEEFFNRVKERNLSMKMCSYIWGLIKMSFGYSFNCGHVLPYSIIGLQEANLVYKYGAIYWNCANLISDSGGQDSTVNYGKIASAVSRMRKEGINIVPPYINDTEFNFRPLADKNEIIFGLKPVSGIGTSIANAIVENQPYTSMEDFYNKMQIYKDSSDEAKFGPTAMIQLIKAGCFDELENKSRQEIMKEFIQKLSNPITKLKIDHIEDMARLNLLTDSQRKWELRLYRYKKYVFTKNNLVKMKGKSASTGYYKLEHKFAEPYFIENFQDKMEIGKDYETTDDGYFIVKRGAFDKVYDKFFEDFKTNTLTRQDFLDIINNDRFKQTWFEKTGSDNISQWEMDSLNYYYHDHVLAHVNREKYEIKNFDDLNSEPEFSSVYYYRGQEKMRYKLCRMCGTVIDKDKNHNTITILTPDGVVVVRLYKGQFGFYDREISRINPDGTKTKVEKSWFKRGTNLLITGFRSEEQFIPRKYHDSIYKHTVQKILEITPDGDLVLQSDRMINDKDEGDGAIGV